MSTCLPAPDGSPCSSCTCTSPCVPLTDPSCPALDLPTCSCNTGGYDLSCNASCSDCRGNKLTSPRVVAGTYYSRTTGSYTCAAYAAPAGTACLSFCASGECNTTCPSLSASPTTQEPASCPNAGNLTCSQCACNAAGGACACLSHDPGPLSCNNSCTTCNGTASAYPSGLHAYAYRCVSGFDQWVGCVTGPCSAGNCTGATDCHFLHAMPPPPPAPPPPLPPPAQPKPAPGTWFSLTLEQREAFLSGLLILPLSIWYGFYRLRKMEGLAKKAERGPEENEWGEGELPDWMEPGDEEGEVTHFVNPPPKKPLLAVFSASFSASFSAKAGWFKGKGKTARDKGVGEEEEEEEEVEETARQIQFVEMTARGGEQAFADEQGSSRRGEQAAAAAAAAGGVPAAHIPRRSSLRLNSKRLAEREIAEAEDDAAMAVALASAAGVEAIAAAHEQHNRLPQDDEGTLPERDLGRLPHSRSQSMENVLRAHSGRLRPSREPSSDALLRGPLEGVMHSGATVVLAPEADSGGTLPPRDARLLASPPSPKDRALSGRLRPSLLPGEE